MLKSEKKFSFNNIRQYASNHIRPDILFMLSFVLVIFIGSILLVLPFSNKVENSYLDALFTATSSTCVTGLVTRVTADQYTRFGHIVILFLIQIGGLGFMTFVSVFLVYNRSKLDSHERTLLKNSLNKDNFKGMSGYIRAIMRFTFIAEFIGFLLIYTQLVGEYGVIKAIFPSLFLSVSAFCNAGIDTLGQQSLIPYQGNLLLNATVAGLIIAGGLGFAVWFDIYHHLDNIRHGKEKLKNFFRRLSLHSRIVLIMTGGLLVSGFAIIFITEFQNTLASIPFPEKILVAFFNSVTLRTAGFASFDYGSLREITKIFMIPYMLIGGSPGGTAGGLKTTTFFILLIVFISQYRGKHDVNVSSREVRFEDVCKAITVIFTYVSFLFFTVAILSTTENATALDILFEASSAIATVGLSTGLTPLLTAVGKLIIILLMFVGRVGPVTIAFMLRRNQKNNLNVRYPHADILVG